MRWNASRTSRFDNSIILKTPFSYLNDRCKRYEELLSREKRIRRGMGDKESFRNFWLESGPKERQVTGLPMAGISFSIISEGKIKTRGRQVGEGRKIPRSDLLRLPSSILADIMIHRELPEKRRNASR